MLTVGLKLARDFGKGIQTRGFTTWNKRKVWVRVGSRVVRGHVVVGGLPQSARTVFVGDVWTFLEQVACQTVGSALGKLLLGQQRHTVANNKTSSPPGRIFCSCVRICCSGRPIWRLARRTRGSARSACVPCLRLGPSLRQGEGSSSYGNRSRLAIEMTRYYKGGQRRR